MEVEKENLIPVLSTDNMVLDRHKKFNTATFELAESQGIVISFKRDCKGFEKFAWFLFDLENYNNKREEDYELVFHPYNARGVDITKEILVFLSVSRGEKLNGWLT